VKVVNLGVVSSLLKEWEAVRQHILQGDIAGGSVCLRSPEGRETIYLFGIYKRDSESALRASMRMSWEMTQADELELPELRSGT
jgi:hypothetical protein